MLNRRTKKDSTDLKQLLKHSFVDQIVSSVYITDKIPEIDNLDRNYAQKVRAVEEVEEEHNVHLLADFADRASTKVHVQMRNLSTERMINNKAGKI